MIACTKAARDVVMLLVDVLHEHHPVLAACEVRVDALMADARTEKDAEKRALKHGGYPAAATIAIVPLKRRALGQGDALLTIDAAVWDGLAPDEQRALIDHELTHLEVARDGAASADGSRVVGVDPDTGEMLGAPKADDLGRPVLRLRLHDWQFGGFTEIARRYRTSALEVQAVRACRDGRGQYFWDFDAVKVEEEA